MVGDNVPFASLRRGPSGRQSTWVDWSSIQYPCLRTLVSGVIFHVVKSKFLPRQQPNKFLRWDYDFVEVGDDPAEKGYISLDLGTEDTDDWTIGSSSSVSSDSRSPIDESDSWEGATLASHSGSEAQR